MNSSADADTRRAQAGAWAQSIRARFRTIILGTTSPDGHPDASVAGAVVGDDGAFHVFVSQLATHTRHLLATGRASVLVVEDEAAAAQPLARRRLTFACAAILVPRATVEHAAALAALRTRLGPAFDLLARLDDFHLFRLSPRHGRLVAGFGQAYVVDPRDWSLLDGPLIPERPASPARTS